MFRCSPKSYFCQADAEAAAKLRAQHSAYHEVEVRVEEHPKYGPGRPSQKQPRVIKALRYGLQPRADKADAITGDRPLSPILVGVKGLFLPDEVCPGLK